jgi:Protein prenyltransferase alpha subunit repeat
MTFDALRVYESCRLLSLDDRNFHGWAYWRWVVKRANVPADKCLAFTDAKLRENFSNYSAWHARSALLTVLLPTVCLLMWRLPARVVRRGESS